jgi:hypothetical protein
MMKMMFGRLAPRVDQAAGRLASIDKAGTRANLIRPARAVRQAREISFSF